ncbi:hypothetical protein BDW60DRAFT_191906, partial [Aspergillus nidulans var. acristatus]
MFASNRSDRSDRIVGNLALLGAVQSDPHCPHSAISAFVIFFVQRVAAILATYAAHRREPSSGLRAASDQVSQPITLPTTVDTPDDRLPYDLGTKEILEDC